MNHKGTKAQRGEWGAVFFGDGRERFGATTSGLPLRDRLIQRQKTRGEYLAVNQLLKIRQRSNGYSLLVQIF
ncbi:MAG: hypothetical protein RLZZ338_4214 [Cyanobacteriota bacterium]|jgi:hypothetical protein